MIIVVDHYIAIFIEIDFTIVFSPFQVAQGIHFKYYNIIIVIIVFLKAWYVEIVSMFYYII